MRAYHYADIPVVSRPGSKYPLHKFAMLVRLVSERNLIDPGGVIAGTSAPRSILLLGHEEGFVERVASQSLSSSEERELGFCSSPDLYRRGATIVGCRLAASSDAIEDGLGLVLGGGSHHAGRKGGRGYCVFNDVACAILHLLRVAAITNAAVLDCDVHQGDGTAEILGGRSDIFTCSIHGEKNYPFRKIPSALDIHLPDSCGDEVYLRAVETGIRECMRNRMPDLLYYIAGADPYEEDRLGRLKITAQALKQRDHLVLRAAFENEVPVVILFGGGYCDPIDQTVERNLATIEVIRDVYRGSLERSYRALRREPIC